MSDTPVTHEELAVSLEATRRFVAATAAMVAAINRPDQFQSLFDAFTAEDKKYLTLIAAIRGERDGPE